MKRKYILGLILIVGMVAGMFTPTSNAYTSTITVTGLVFAFDVSHGGYHANADDLAPIMNNLTAAGNQVVVINETWDLWDNVSMLFITQPDDNFTLAEKADIVNWLELGNKTLIVGGDSDYGGYYSAYPVNSLLEYIGTVSRMAGVSIDDPVNNDGAAYRVATNYSWDGQSSAGTTWEGAGDIAAALSNGMLAGNIMHGPTAVVAFSGGLWYDLRIDNVVFPNRVEPIMFYSPNATATDSDVSAGDIDLYDGEVGDFPAVVYEDLDHALVNSTTSNMIIAGECFWTYYKFMYEQITESGVYNSGVHYGRMLMNNIINELALPYEPEVPVETSFSFILIPLAIIGSLYVLVRRRK
jgi:hypothetical protein